VPSVELDLHGNFIIYGTCFGLFMAIILCIKSQNTLGTDNLDINFQVGSKFLLFRVEMVYISVLGIVQVYRKVIL
jgi:hypothetical protein